VTGQGSIVPFLVVNLVQTYIASEYHLKQACEDVNAGGSYRKSSSYNASFNSSSILTFFHNNNFLFVHQTERS